MLGRIVEIGHDQRYLSVQRGFMVVRTSGDEHVEVGHVPLDDIAAVIANAHGLSYSNNLLVALAERGAPFVLCGRNHQVAGMLWPANTKTARPVRLVLSHKRISDHSETQKPLLEQEVMRRRF